MKEKGSICSHIGQKDLLTSIEDDSSGFQSFLTNSSLDLLGHRPRLPLRSAISKVETVVRHKAVHSTNGTYRSITPWLLLTPYLHHATFQAMRSFAHCSRRHCAQCSRQMQLLRALHGTGQVPGAATVQRNGKRHSSRQELSTDTGYDQWALVWRVLP